MTISKKLLLIATFGLYIPFNASAIHTTIEIDLNNEMAIIESYMPLLRNQPTIGAEKVVQWLNKKLQQQSLKKHDAITIANILTTNTSINTKVADILYIIRIKETAKADKARIASQQKRKSIVETALVCGMCVLFGGLIVLDAIVNPYPKCQACRYGDYFFVNGHLRCYAHTCEPHIHHYNRPLPPIHIHSNPSPRVHFRINV